MEKKYFKEYALERKDRHDYKSLFECVNKFEKELLLFEFEFLGRQGTEFNFPEYEELVLESKSGLVLDWNTWSKITADTVQIMDLLMVRPVSNFKEVNCDDLKGTTSFFLECVDGYNINNQWMQQAISVLKY